MGIEHIFKRMKMFAMKAIVDLHAADIDEFGSLPASFRKLNERFLQGSAEKRVPVHIHRISVQYSFFPRFGKPNCIQNRHGYRVFMCCAQHFAFADIVRQLIRECGVPTNKRRK